MSTTYEWGHQRPGERERLDLMSQILDPRTELALARIPIGAGWRCLELGAGNGSISRALSARVGDAGLVVAADIDTSLLQDSTDSLQVRQLDVTTADLGEDAYDVVATRAMLHHLPSRRDVLAKMLRAVRPGGFIYVEEPDLHPTSTTSGAMHEFWVAFLQWAARHEIDYFVGRSIAPWLAKLGAQVIESNGHTAVYNGGSPFALWWQEGVAVVSETLMAEGAMTADQIDAFMVAYSDPQQWTMSIQFTQTIARKL